MVSPETYAALVQAVDNNIHVSYERPQNPGPLTIGENETRFQIIELRNQHAEATWLFREVLGLEWAHIQQIIVTAIEPEFLKV